MDSLGRARFETRRWGKLVEEAEEEEEEEYKVEVKGRQGGFVEW